MDSDKEYLSWVSSLKERIQTAQIKAAIAVNEELIVLYWKLENRLLKNRDKIGGELKSLSRFPKIYDMNYLIQMAFQEPTCLT